MAAPLLPADDFSSVLLEYGRVKVDIVGQLVNHVDFDYVAGAYVEPGSAAVNQAEVASGGVQAELQSVSFVDEYQGLFAVMDPTGLRPR